MKKVAKKITKLPNKVYYPEIDDTYSVISYYEKPDDGSVKKIKIPNWLAEMISYEVVNESEKAVIDFKKEIIDMFKYK